MLMEYRVGTTGTAVASVATIPFSMKSSVELLENSANVDLIFQPNFGSSKGLQSVLIEWYLGKGVTTSSWIPGGGGGTCTYDSRSGVSVFHIINFQHSYHISSFFSGKYPPSVGPVAAR